MKVMQINCVYKKGSTGKIVYDIHTELKKNNIESIVCYGRGKIIKEENVYKTSSEILAKFNNLKSRFTGSLYDGCFFATNKLLNIIKKEQPDIVHLHCINGFFVNIYRLLKFLAKNQIKTLVTHHGEFLYTGNCGHALECEKWNKECGNCPKLKYATGSVLFDRTYRNRKKMKNGFAGIEKLYSVGVSEWVKDRADKSNTLKNAEHITILNGIDTEVFKYNENYKNLKLNLNIENKKVVLFVTSIFSSAIKGGKYILELSKHIDNDTVIIIVGNSQKIENLPENVIAVGRCENQKELAKYYSMADLTVLTSFRETFSMPVAESLCCGTPVVGFKAGGPETIAIDEYSEFVEYGNIDKLSETVKKFLVLNFDKKNISQIAIQKYNKERMTNEYIDLYNKIRQ